MTTPATTPATAPPPRVIRAAKRAAFFALPEAEQQATADRVAALLREATWHVAKTMPENPHEYTLRRQWARDEDFVFAVETIRLLGYQQKYNGRAYNVYDAGGHFHWTLGWPVGSLDWGWGRLNVAGTILINRKPLPQADAEGRTDALPVS